MRRFCILAVIGLALGGCALTETYNNPLDKNALATTESSYGVVLSGAVAYRDLCNRKIIAREKCAPVVTKLQVADLKVKVALKNLRTFVKNNPTLDASSLLLAVKNAVDDFKVLATTNGAV